ncbi:MAG TPA: helix-turn-helix domain-containing protein [Polyangiaceae bacterium]
MAPCVRPGSSRPGSAWRRATRIPPPSGSSPKPRRCTPSISRRPSARTTASRSEPFVRAHRVFHAVSLLHRGDDLAEVSSACGFADQSHMTRLIRAERGLPPGKLQKRLAATPRTPP